MRNEHCMILYKSGCASSFGVFWAHKKANFSVKHPSNTRLYLSYKSTMKYGTLKVGHMGARSQQLCKNYEVAKNDALIIQKTNKQKKVLTRWLTIEIKFVFHKNNSWVLFSSCLLKNYWGPNFSTYVFCIYITISELVCFFQQNVFEVSTNRNNNSKPLNWDQKTKKFGSFPFLPSAHYSSPPPPNYRARTITREILT